VSPSFSEGFSRELDHERAQAITLAQTYAQEHGELLAARAELENVRKKNGYLEEQLEASKNDAVKSRQMEEDAVRSREEQRRSFQTASRALKEETERSEVLKARVKDLERDLSASLSVSAQLRRSLSDMQAEKEDAMRSSRKAQGEIDMLASTFESVQREGQTLQADIIKERRSFLEHQRATSREIESLTERLDRSYRQAAKATAKKETVQRSLDSVSADLFNLRQTYKATIEQFVDLKEKYREEQRLRWTAEAEAARLRGMMPRG
jgi:chromosome segregation ATPase